MDDATRPVARRLTGPQRRRRILDAAVEAFAARGYDGASMRAIAAASGVTKPVLYDHFASKRDLFVALIETISAGLMRRAAEAMALDLPLGERITAGIDAFFEEVEARPAEARLLLVTPRAEPALAEASRALQDRVTLALADLLAAEPGLLAGARDRPRRLEMAAEFVKQGLHGLAEWWAGHPDVPRAQVAAAAREIVWSGLRGHLAQPRPPRP
jgi:AcrR family transcriptional regulator